MGSKRGSRWEIGVRAGDPDEHPGEYTSKTTFSDGLEWYKGVIGVKKKELDALFLELYLDTLRRLHSDPTLDLKKTFYRDKKS